jgi:hypothetical protein
MGVFLFLKYYSISRKYELCAPVHSLELQARKNAKERKRNKKREGELEV